MVAWMIEPRDPLVLRDGRPNQGRSESATRAFALPSTIAGAVRTRLGLGPDGAFAKTSEQELTLLRSVGIRGPLLAEADGGTFYVPTPKDLVVLGGSNTPPQIAALVPELQLDAMFDDGMSNLRPTVLRAPVDGGKPADPPQFLAWSEFRQWLISPGPRTYTETRAFLDAAIDELPVETRMHVKVGLSGTAEDGMLFEIDGTRFVRMRNGTPLPLSLWVDVDESALSVGELRAGLAPLGGKRRLVRWTQSNMHFPSIPSTLLTTVGESARSLVRVVLLTPAVFEQGYRPSLMPGTPLGPANGTSVRLVAACVGRPIAISGWDMAKRQPKRTRRAAPAGSVYWLELEGSSEARLTWANRVWGSSVCEDLQDQRDGFGLAAIGLAGGA